MPQLIVPIQTALNTRDREVMVRVIRILQRLVLSDVTQSENGNVLSKIGISLVPYYRQILPIFNIFKNSNLNIGDKIDYSQQKNENLGDLINVSLKDLIIKMLDVENSRVVRNVRWRRRLHQLEIFNSNVSIY